MFEIPLTLYYYKPQKDYLQKEIKLKLIGYKQTDDYTIGKLKLDINSLINRSSPYFNPMMEFVDDKNKSTEIYVSVEMSLQISNQKKKTKDELNGNNLKGVKEQANKELTENDQSKLKSVGDSKSVSCDKTRDKQNSKKNGYSESSDLPSC